MNAGNDKRRWGWVSQALHWLMAAMILGNMALGLWADGLALSPRKLELFLWHKSLGLSVLGLALLRLLWRWWQGAPDEPAGMAAWQRLSARASHVMLYGLMFVMPLTGYLANAAANVPLRWFGLFTVPALIEPSEAWGEWFEEAHELLFWLFLALVLVHAAAALKHHFVDRDSVLRRMLPFGRRA